MSDQPNLPGTAPDRVQIEGKRLNDYLIATGALGALREVAEELEGLRKQHPAAPGLTIALAVVHREVAEYRLDCSRIALTVAAKVGMSIDNCVIQTEFDKDRVMLRSIPGEAS